MISSPILWHLLRCKGGRMVQGDERSGRVDFPVDESLKIQKARGNHNVNKSVINEIMLRDSVTLATHPAGGVVAAHTTFNNHTSSIFLRCEAEEVAHSQSCEVITSKSMST